MFLSCFRLPLLVLTLFGIVHCQNEIQWKDPRKYNYESFASYVAKNTQPSDFFYIFTGDTQYWYECTPDNHNCLAETKCKVNWHALGKYQETVECSERQGNYANRVQQRSINSMNKLLSSSVLRRLSGLIINGDLVMYGNQSEVARLDRDWMSFFDFKVYPGLGNHELYNSVGKCKDQECVNRILVYFLDYVGRRLHYSMDYTRTKDPSGKDIVTGSLSYSWDECINSLVVDGSRCFHFVQLNCHPLFETVIDSPSITWHIKNSLQWLENDLRAHYGKPVIINFHVPNFQSYFPHKANARILFIDLLKRVRPNLVAIMFAHLHENVGDGAFSEVWCYDRGTKKVPFIFSGSVPGNNYVLAQFSPATKTVKSLYIVHAVNDTFSTVEEFAIRHRCDVDLY